MAKSLKKLIILPTLLLGVCLLIIAVAPEKANAAYDAGRIIDNGQFLDARSMSASDIQNFLIGKNSGLRNMNFTLSCYGSGSKERQLYTAAGARCDTPIPASQIIYYAAQIYGINPKVILTTMQKEQSLTTAPNPTSWQLNQAMGYACPTSGQCGGNSTFPYQIDSGTWALRYHYERANGNFNWWTTSSSWTCGTEKHLYKPNLYPGQNVRFYDTNGTHYTTVYINNAATSTMYCYTPHAYNNPQGLYGRAPYGNTGLYYSGSYNFVYFYELWFGSTQTSYQPFENPRWMVLNKNQRKTVPGSDSSAPNDATLLAGRQVRFTSKIWTNNQWYYRTAYDSDFGYNKGIPASSLDEIMFQAFSEPRWMSLNVATAKYNPRSERSSGQKFNPGLNLRFVDKMLINGKWYYRSQSDSSNGFILAFPADKVNKASFVNFETPRIMEVKANINKVDPVTTTTTNQSLIAGQQIHFSKKILLGVNWYCQTSDDAAAQNNNSIPCTSIKNVPYTSIQNGAPGRWMEVSGLAKKVRPSTGEVVDAATYSSGRQIYFLQSISVSGIQYFRSSYDTENQNDLAIKASDLKEIQFVPFENPRKLKLASDNHKIDPRTGSLGSQSLLKDREVEFSSKIYIDSKWYYRTTFDTTNNNSLAVSSDSLTELRQ